MQVNTKIDFINKSAVFSEDKVYRYTLERRWLGGNGKNVNWLMLNPSVADENMEDPTIRRCCLYARDWGYSGIVITNIFSFRDTDPKNMKSYHAPIGPFNDKWILEIANSESTGILVGGWGQHGSHLNRNNQIKAILNNINVYCLGRTKCNNPLHPLYLKKNILPTLLW